MADLTDKKKVAGKVAERDLSTADLLAWKMDTYSGESRVGMSATASGRLLELRLARKKERLLAQMMVQH